MRTVAFGGRNGWRRACAGRLTPRPGGGTRVAARFVGLPTWAPAAAGAALAVVASAFRVAHGRWAGAAFGLGVGAPLLTGAGWALGAVGARNVDRDDAFPMSVLTEETGVPAPAA